MKRQMDVTNTIRPGTVTLAFFLAAAAVDAQAPRFNVSVPAAAHASPVTGRLIVVLSKSAQPEPRYTVSPQGPAIFAVDLDQLAPGEIATVDEKSLGYPRPLAELPPGDYYAQAVINVYEQVHRSDGKTIWVHINDGKQEVFQIAEGNLYSDVQPIHVGNGGTITLNANHVMPAQPGPKDSNWVKYIRIPSKKVSDFWGKPVYFYATVLLPKGYADHPDARYPTVFTFGHNVPFGFSTDSARARRGALDPVTGLESGFDFYQSWIGERFPRFIAVSFEQQTPYFPDGYSVNSANNGPYGDAMIEEVIPYLEQHFRMIAKPYARLVEGASTGGWQSLALMLQHPDFFGGAWVLQPDPIDFERFGLLNIYADTNAFVVPNSQFSVAERTFRRTSDGQEVWSVRLMSLFEEVLGTRGRSGYQYEGWEAIYGPTDAEGYPKPLFNKLTGSIDREVAAYYRDHGYDLRVFAQKNWPALGPKLSGKLHFFAGDMDHFFLNLAVYRWEEFVKSTTSPHSDADFTYGRPMKGHGWHAFPWAEFVRRMGAQVKKNAPSGEDVSRWNY